jgi:hypothetical protein
MAAWRKPLTWTIGMRRSEFAVLWANSVRSRKTSTAAWYAVARLSLFGLNDAELAATGRCHFGGAVAISLLWKAARRSGLRRRLPVLQRQATVGSIASASPPHSECDLPRTEVFGSFGRWLRASVPL